jgi:hypothetical protein
MFVLHPSFVRIKQKLKILLSKINDSLTISQFSRTIDQRSHHPYISDYLTLFFQILIDKIHLLFSTSFNIYFIIITTENRLISTVHFSFLIKLDRLTVFSLFILDQSNLIIAI